MPGRYFLTTPLDQVAAEFSAALDAPDPGPRPNAAPGEMVAAITGDPRRMVEMRWGMIPMGRVNARKRPVMETIINARSETLFKKSAIERVRRANLPIRNAPSSPSQRSGMSGKVPLVQKSPASPPSQPTPTPMWPRSITAWA